MRAFGAVRAVEHAGRGAHAELSTRGKEEVVMMMMMMIIYSIEK